MAPAPISTPSRTAMAIPVPPRAGRPSTVTMYLVLVELGPGDESDILRAQVIWRAGRNALKRHLRVGVSELGHALEIVALGGRQRGTRLIAVMVVDDAE